MKRLVGAADGFASFVVCSGFAVGGLAVVCVKEDASTFVDACVIEVGFSK